MFVQSITASKNSTTDKGLTNKGSGCVIKPSSWPSRAIPPPRSPGPWRSLLAPSSGPGRPLQLRGAWRPSGSTHTACSLCLAAADVPRFRECLRGWAHARGRRLHPPLPGLVPYPGGGIRRQSAPPALYDLLHRLGYSSLMPRPQHEQANSGSTNSQC